MATVFEWWVEQMRALMPAFLRPLGRSWRRVLVVVAEAVDATEIGLHMRGHGGDTPLGRHALGSGLRNALGRLPKALRQKAVLQIPAGFLLRRQAIFPLSAALDLREVVRHEIDRLTPFSASDVLWNCAIERRDNEHGRIHVQLTIVPLLQVRPMLDALRQIGLSIVRIEAAHAERIHAIPIADGGGKPGWAGGRALAWLRGGCGVLAATAVSLPFILQGLARDDVESRIASMRPQVVEAEKLRKVIASGTTIADAISAARSQVGNPLQSVALLTEMLPDDTYLTLLTIRQRALSISGRSTSSARLIGLLAAHPMLQNPAFAAPVVRDEASGGEMFSIRIGTGP